MPLRIPPGRMGRLWLRERLAVAAHAADVLEQKRRALRTEVERLDRVASGTRERWEGAARRADTALLDAVLAGGERQLVNAAAYLPGAPEARVVWQSTMGLAYPSEAECEPGPALDVADLAETSALPFAVEAHRAAVVAAVEHAAAQRALDLVSDELHVTTHRLRAIERRWMPRLEAALHDVDRQLEEREREDIVRAKFAAERRRTGSLTT